MSIAIPIRATLTGDRLRRTWWQPWSSPAIRTLLSESTQSERVLEATVGSTAPDGAVSRSIIVRQQLDELAGLAPGWDGSTARAISPEYIEQAWKFVSSDLVADLSTKPDLVPTYAGGLQIEWHTEAIDLVLELGPDGPSFYLCDNQEHVEIEAVVGDHTNDIASAFVKLGLGR